MISLANRLWIADLRSLSPPNGKRLGFWGPEILKSLPKQYLMLTRIQNCWFSPQKHPTEFYKGCRSSHCFSTSDFHSLRIRASNRITWAWLVFFSLLDILLPLQRDPYIYFFYKECKLCLNKIPEKSNHILNVCRWRCYFWIPPWDSFVVLSTVHFSDVIGNSSLEPIIGDRRLADPRSFLFICKVSLIAIFHVEVQF